MAMPQHITAQMLRDPRYQLAQALTKQGTSTAPVQHWMQGAARLGQALAGTLKGNRVREEYDDKSKAYSTALANALKGENPYQTLATNTDDPTLQMLGTEGLLKQRQWQQQQAAEQAQRQEERAWRDQQAQADRDFRMTMFERQQAARPAASEPLQAVVGENGKPVLVPRSEAVGMTPYDKPSSPLVHVGTNPETGEPIMVPQPGPLSSSAQKEVFEADDLVQQSETAMGLIDEALALNDQAFSGATALERAGLAKYDPTDLIDDEGANATIQLDNIIRSQALESLKATFGGMPTEGERKVLMELQASAEKTPEQRRAILERAKQMARRRLDFNRQKAQSLRSGTYFVPGMGAQPIQPTPPSQSPAPQAQPDLQDGEVPQPPPGLDPAEWAELYELMTPEERQLFYRGQ